jgi:Ca-activated chloride channel family protein
VAGQAPEFATLAHHDERGGFFTLIVQPQKVVTDEQVFPRELIFIVDTSGSMYGYPLEKSKEAMKKLIQGMRPLDMFNVVRFAGDTGTLWNKPRPYTPIHASEALRYIESFQGSGGTEMQKGILEALAQPASEGYLRIAFLLTDGYIGDEFRIFQTIEKEKRGARVFSLGVGSSVNRYLLDRVAELGRGEAFYVRQDENSDLVIEKFFQRVDRPVLAHLEIDWGKLDVTELYPSKVPDLWAGQPIRIHGRYQRGGEETIVIRGQMIKRPFEQRLPVQFPQSAPAYEAIATVWAREKVHELMNRMVREGQTKQLIEQVTQLGLTYHLMTQWTSLVAVEEKVVNQAGEIETVVQPVEMPEGVSYEGVFGEQKISTIAQSVPQMKRSRAFDFLSGSVPATAAAMPPSFSQNKGPSPTMAYPAEESMADDDYSFDALKMETAKEDDDFSLGMDIEEETISSTKQNKAEKEERRLAAVEEKYIISFESNQTFLTKAARRILNQIAAQVCPELAQIKMIVIVGYTDSTPNEDHKQKLSLQRAIVVYEYLKQQCPALADHKVEIKGEGDHLPIATNDNAVVHAQNRRVEIQIKR